MHTFHFHRYFYKLNIRYGDKYAFSISCKSIVTNDLPDQSSIQSFQTNIGNEFDALSFKPTLSLLQYETDILGFINFCLRIEDSALSGPSRFIFYLPDIPYVIKYSIRFYPCHVSRSKVLNEITNDVFKAIMIGYEPLVQETLSRFSSYRYVY